MDYLSLVEDKPGVEMTSLALPLQLWEGICK